GDDPTGRTRARGTGGGGRADHGQRADPGPDRWPDLPPGADAAGGGAGDRGAGRRGDAARHLGPRLRGAEPGSGAAHALGPGGGSRLRADRPRRHARAGRHPGRWHRLGAGHPPALHQPDRDRRRLPDRHLRRPAGLRQHPNPATGPGDRVRDLGRRAGLHLHPARGRHLPQRRPVHRRGRGQRLENHHGRGIRRLQHPGLGQGHRHRRRRRHADHHHRRGLRPVHVLRPGHGSGAILRDRERDRQLQAGVRSRPDRHRADAVRRVEGQGADRRRALRQLLGESAEAGPGGDPAGAGRQHPTGPAPHRRDPDGRQRRRALPDPGRRGAGDRERGHPGAPDPGLAAHGPQARRFPAHDQGPPGARFRDPDPGHHRQAAQGPRRAQHRRPGARQLGAQPEHRAPPLRPGAGQGATGRGRANPGRRRRAGRQGADDGPQRRRRRGQAVRDRTLVRLRQLRDRAQLPGRRPKLELDRDQDGGLQPGHLDDLGARGLPVHRRDDGLDVDLDQRQRPVGRVLLGQLPDPRPAGRLRRQPARLLPRVQLPGRDRRPNRSRRRHHRPGGAQGDLRPDPGGPAPRSAGDLHVLAEQLPGRCPEHRRLLAERLHLPDVERAGLVFDGV
ncbi:MAG: hypothetical protein AVDCRST_MAG73-2358, partial [uncultured Thermomicrobiales bacterium]